MSRFVWLGAFFLILGLIIRVGKKVELLPGYNKEDFDDKEGLAKWSGNMLFLMSVLSLGGILIGHLISHPIVGLVMGVVYSMMLICGGIMVLMVGSAKFKNKK
ncbi:MAG: DUF3784 domain-containing protein [Candidatus Latescibacteria bacterium]|jgi:hypothetical protein|nr:DUF3784 domain-containing protein [Candidatus Latescibacterota bacterium]MBT4138485.1 DUF3784 domain-containing protein [Candidatus Latescibacterota bacterium]MBT5830105.1 DUF3784 domain-containing protein [Candidatus Latescibacterota bacterium]